MGSQIPIKSVLKQLNNNHQSLKHQDICRISSVFSLEPKKDRGTSLQSRQLEYGYHQSWTKGSPCILLHSTHKTMGITPCHQVHSYHNQHRFPSHHTMFHFHQLAAFFSKGSCVGPCLAQVSSQVRFCRNYLRFSRWLHLRYLRRLIR